MTSEEPPGDPNFADDSVFLPAAGKLRGDFSYRIIENVVLSHRRLEHSLWTGAVLRGCKFADVSFDRGDFAGTKFIDCEFIRCSFEPDELRSCTLHRVRFVDCALVGVQCVSSQFQGCEFIRCDLSRSVIRECQFADSVFEDVPFRSCSVTLNHYSRSTFRKVFFADATILFLIFEDCEFDDCVMNAETVGYTFGLSIEHLESLELVYLGESQPRPTEGALLPALLESYDARGWILGICLLKINFGIEATYLALREFANRLGEIVAREPRVDWDELAFLSMVLEQLQERQELPFLGIWEVHTAVTSALVAMEREQSGFATLLPAANTVAWRLRRLAVQRMTEVSHEVIAGSGRKPEIELHLALVRQPGVRLDEAIPSELKLVAGANDSDFRLVRSWEGSWFEFWQLSLAALGALNVTLVLVDTSWERATKIWKRAKAARTALKKRSKSGSINESTKTDLAAADASARTLSGAIDLPTVATAVENATAELRVISQMDREALLRLDLAVQRMRLLSDPVVRQLLEYAAPALRGVELVAPVKPEPASIP
jgi:uncharacterized protein YjbI with pentapeptide repeats